MGYEKKYNEALDRASKLRVQNPFDTVGQMVEHIFPELRESEDERIRKSIISILKGEIRYISIEDTNKYVAWLENQREKTNPYSGISFEYNGHIWGMCARDNGVDILLDKQLFKHLEKQADHKTLDKVEPKFKVGDWIVGDEGIFKITQYEDNYGYELIDTTGHIVHFISPDYVESKYHLWTIQDAKDGDVLQMSDVLQLSVVTVIFQKYIGNLNCKCYCSIYDGEFDIPRQDVCDSYGCYNATPATKEQRDTLFTKMKEAGYEWDAEKKELNQIEDEIEIPFSAKDSELQEATYFIPKGFHAEIDDGKVVIKKGEKPTAWSEEDERIYYSLLADIRLRTSQDNSTNTLEAYYNEQIDWLKSLKNRIQFQQKKVIV